MKIFELRITCVTCPECGEDLRYEGCEDGGHEITALEEMEQYTLEFEGGHALAQSILNHARSELERNGLIGGLV